jgi:hypothetical protein
MGSFSGGEAVKAHNVATRTHRGERSPEGGGTIRSPKDLGERFARDLVEMGTVERLDFGTAAGVIAAAIEEDRRQAPRNEEDTLP